MASRSCSESSYRGAVHRLAQQFEALTKTNFKSRSFSQHVSSNNFTSVPSSSSTGHHRPGSNFRQANFDRLTPIELEVEHEYSDSGNSSPKFLESPTSRARVFTMSPIGWNLQKSAENVFEPVPLQQVTQRKNSLGHASKPLRRTPMTSSVGSKSLLANPSPGAESWSNYYEWKSMASNRDNERKLSDGIIVKTLSQGIGQRSHPATRVQTVSNPQWGLQGTTTTIRRRDPALIDQMNPRLLFP